MLAKTRVISKAMTASETELKGDRCTYATTLRGQAFGRERNSKAWLKLAMEDKENRRWRIVDVLCVRLRSIGRCGCEHWS